jgi:hypothetical protein
MAQLIHQIGNSIGAVGLHAQVIARLTPAPAEKEHADAILGEVRSLALLLEQLRNLAAGSTASRRSSR